MKKSLRFLLLAVVAGLLFTPQAFAADAKDEKPAPAVNPGKGNDAEAKMQEAIEKMEQELLAAVDGKDVEARLEAIKKLSGIGGEKSAEKFLALLATEKDQKVIDAVKASFVNLGGTTPEVLAKALDSQDANAKKAAESVLPGVLETVYTYAWRMGNDKDSYRFLYKHMAAVYIEKLGAKALPFLKEKLEKAKDNQLERTRCMFLLGASKLPEAVEIIKPYVSDKFVEVRYMAARALGMIGKTTGKDSIVKLMSDDNTYVRQMALDALAGLEGDVALEPFINVITGKNLAEAKDAANVVTQMIGADKAPKVEKEEELAKVWQEWWSKNKATVKGKTIPVEVTVGEMVPANVTE